MTARTQRLLTIIKPFFNVKELVTREFYDLLGEDAICIFEEKILITLVDLRLFFGKRMYVNTWMYGGAIDGRGYRDLKEDTGGLGSQHRQANGIDFTVDCISAEEARLEILANSDVFPHLRRMEKDVSWVHFDLKETDKKEIVLF